MNHSKSAIALLAWLLGTPIAAHADGPFFVEDFEEPGQNASLEAYAPDFVVENGAIHRSETGEPRYLRTVSSDYDGRDVDFEITFVSAEAVVYVGLGAGTPDASAQHQPANSIALAVSPLSTGGAVELISPSGRLRIGEVSAAGPHRARISKRGVAVSLEFDDSWSGEFSADASTSLGNFLGAAPALDETNTHFFFGTGSAAATFDDLSVSDPHFGYVDCNLNDVHDGYDIADGVSADLDADGVPDECQSPFFEEDFESSSRNLSLEPYDPYFLVGGGLIRRDLPTDPSDRRYVRTLLSDYIDTEFVYELTFFVKETVVFIGIGMGTRGTPANEPAASVVLKARPTSILDGMVDVKTSVGSAPFGTLTSPGPHRARITKVRRSITFEVDESYDGLFAADMSISFLDLEKIGPFLDASSSHLFFGTVSDEDAFDDLSVRAPEDPFLDCNENDVEDLVDIADETSSDADANGIPDECELPRAYFEEDFETAAPEPGLDDYFVHFAIDEGSLRKMTSTPAERRYVRTALSDYVSRDFAAELTVDLAAGDTSAVFVGLGPGEGTGEPQDSIFLRLRAPHIVGGRVDLQAKAIGTFELGYLTTTGPHRVRIVKRGELLTIAVDAQFDGTFRADMSRTIVDLDLNAPYLTNGSSRLFFGSDSALDRYDDLTIREVDASAVDCNENGIDDAMDIAEGRSADVDTNGVPDECQTPDGSVSAELVELGAGCVGFVLTNEIPIRGGELGLAFDSTRVVAASVEPGADFPGTADDIVADLDAQVNCAVSGVGAVAGLTVGWINEGTGALLAPGQHELLRIYFTPSDHANGGLCSPLKFVECLGVPAAPIGNTATSETNLLVEIDTEDSEICADAAAFVRGDANKDGKFDISDPIVILGCLFLGDPCPTCPDAADSNDDGAVNITDASYLLSWRFLGGPIPPGPFPGCGIDRTDDDLGDCVFDTALCR